MKRRAFVRLCAFSAGCMAAPAAVLNSGIVHARDYGRSLLINSGGDPVRPSALTTGTNYIFHYPHVSTPCFLLRLARRPEPQELSTREGHSYQWNGGVGPDGTIVAFSAICAHKMAHPSRQLNVISFRPDVTRFGSGAGVISCCAENSVYDPARGARVIGGPAPQPLAAIRLEHDEDRDVLHATGVVGGDMFHRFFDEYGVRLELEYGEHEGGFEAPVGATATVHRMETFSARTVTCGVDPDAWENA